MSKRMEKVMQTMDRFSVFAPRLLPAAEPFVAAMRSCPGCGQALAVRIIGKALADHGRYPYGGVAARCQCRGFSLCRLASLSAAENAARRVKKRSGTDTGSSR